MSIDACAAFLQRRASRNSSKGKKRPYMTAVAIVSHNNNNNNNNSFNLARSHPQPEVTILHQ